jgi:RNA polymerase sigma-70 factor (ECF subfamily)
VTDAELISDSLVNTAAFAVLFDRHYRAIHRFLHARIGRALAEDIASETFTVAFRRRATYDLSRPNARPWLYGIAVNILRDHRRTEQRRLSAYARAAHTKEMQFDSDETGLDPTVAAALLELSASDRHLILLYAWAQLSYEELAEALSLPLGTVRSRLSRTRSKLRATLASLDAAPLPTRDSA